MSKQMCPHCDEEKPNVEFKTTIGGDDVYVCECCYNAICDAESLCVMCDEEDEVKGEVVCVECGNYICEYHTCEDDDDGAPYCKLCFKIKEQAEQKKKKVENTANTIMELAKKQANDAKTPQMWMAFALAMVREQEEKEIKLSACPAPPGSQNGKKEDVLRQSEHPVLASRVP